MGKAAKKGAMVAANEPLPAFTESLASLKPTKAPAADSQQDVRVTQQRRILEMVGTESIESRDDSKKYSPRTEKHVVNLAGFLEHFNFTRGDIAKLVKRCQHDESQIQVAVGNILEDKVNHEQDSWGEVKTKKQVKDEKKCKEEEEKAEHERILRDVEKQRKDAEKRAAREAQKAKDSGAWPMGAEDGGNGLPPDPAILFAGQKPGHAGGDAWWEGAPGWRDGRAWNWQDSWDRDDWHDKSKGGNHDSWWSGDWGGDMGVKNTSGGDDWQPARGKKAKDRKAKSGEPKPDEADVWDMPDAAASTEGGLDQWALGDIRAHERRMEGQEAPSTEMRTVEDIEREQMGLAGATPSAMKGLPPPPNAAPVISDGKQRLDALLQAGAASSAAAQQQIDRPEGRGEQGCDGAQGHRGDEGKGRERGGRDDKPERPVQSARPEAEWIERLDRSDDPRRQPIQERGDNVTVKKHSTMGCAVVTMQDTRVKEAVLNSGEVAKIQGIRVQLKRHMDKDSKEEVKTDVFVAWGRQVEKTTPLSEHEIMKYFEKRHDEYTETWRAEAAAEADEAMKAQQQLEEQQRQQLEQRQREEARRRWEEDEQRRQQEEAQRHQQDQMRSYEQQRSNIMRDLGHANWAQGTQASTALSQAAPASTQSMAMPSTSGAYPQQRQQQAQQAWSAAQQQWMAMAYQQGWTPQSAAMAQQARGVPQMHPGAMGQMAAPTQDHAYDHASQQRAATAYYYALMAEQQRGGNAAYAQQGGYGTAQQCPAAYGYGGARGNARI